MKLLEPIIAPLRRMLRSPLGELNRWQRGVRYTIGLFRFGAAQLEEDRASQMAAALTYRTIFSLVPLFVLSLLVFNAFGGFASVGGNLRETIYDYLGLTAITLTEATADPAPGSSPGSDPGRDDTGGERASELGPIYGPEPEPAPPPPETPATDDNGEPLPPDAQPTGEDPADLDADQFQPAGDAEPDPETKARIDQLLTGLQEQVAEVSFAGIGFVGLGVLIWAALSLVVSLEQCFNRIYRAPQGRPWHLRIMIYWGVITLGPVLLALSFYMTSQLIGTAESISGVGWLVGLLTPFASLAATWLLLLLIYTLMPNVKVHLRSALIGALTAAVLWELSKWGFRFYVERAVGYSALYGSLGLVPLFLIWIYVTWLVILFGLEVSYIAQTVDDFRFLRARSGPDDTASAVAAPAAIVTVAAALGRAFDRGESLAPGGIASATGLPPRAVEQFTAALCRAKLVHQLEGDDDGAGDLSLARPAERIRVAELIEVGQGIAPLDDLATEAGTSALYARLRHAERDAAQRQTLRDLLGASPRSSAEDPEAGHPT
jgi:membrane protein